MVNNESNTRRTLMAVLAGLALIGGGFYVNQLINGLQVTGMNNSVSWGLYIVTFAFLVGLSAGGLIISSSAYVLKIERLKSVAPIGVVVAVACIIGAAAMIMADVGHPERVLNIVFGGRFTSPIAWDFLVISIYLLVGLYECWIFFSNKWKGESEEKREHKLAKAAIFSLPIALLVHSITAWIFGLQVGKPYWDTALMAPIFISSAVVSGVGLLLLVAHFGRKVGIPGLDKENLGTLAKVLVGFIFLDLFLLFCDLFTLVYSGGTVQAEAALLILTGKFAPLLWFELIVGMVVPLFILGNKSTNRSTGWLAIAGLLVMVAVFLKRINIILPGFLVENISFAPGVSTGRFVESTGNFFEAGQTSFSLIPSYVPTFSEIAITVGVLSLVAFIIVYGTGLVRNMGAQTDVNAGNAASRKVVGGKNLTSGVAK
ncbi:polysulfide reductase [Desulfitobacterium dichloroeliminans LMG P-21439]|uniref:Polysulfide reductase n=1 Tax=Desulfitobacterium dichloroeliminans (strain LMG P-21439 / DCA1) TaxID=871963 RepID=L0F801_DESDL|nr:NrfD/PsrC family molybdoenzyme membrane anchor subunit [Desulfitobacterium dichloroeliminans]AGA69155.1 polysulfide reductase [Desulfitobacterium dichloroeliminans LMG P-21439]